MRIRKGVRSKSRFASALVIASLVIWLAWDYRTWKSLGPGGLPANLRGWLVMTRFRLVARDELNLTPLLASTGTAVDVTAWNAVRPRPGVRPVISPYPIPHRQLDQLPDESVRLTLAQLFDRTVREHADRVEYALSFFEKRHSAITLRAPLSRNWRATVR